MAKYLNHRSTIQCTHGGRVILFPPAFRSLQVVASPVLTEQDLLQAMIAGCGQVGPGVKPCTKITQVVMGRGIQIRVDGQVPILDTLIAMTDGSPPGMVSPQDSGQSNAATAGSTQASVFREAARSGAAFCEP